MSAPAGITEGSFTTDGTEQTLFDQAVAGIYQLVLDTTNMVLGDSVTLRWYRAANSSGPQVLAGSVTYTDVQTIPLRVFGPFAVSHMADSWQVVFTIQRIAGADETYVYSVEAF